MAGNLKKKKTNNIYYENLTIDNLYKSWNVVRITCKNKKEVYKFSLNLSTNINYIYNNLDNKTYIPNKYKIFMIFEPKARLVMSSSIQDKIVNHFITNNYLSKYIETSLVECNVATRKNKGTSYASKLIMSYLNKLVINNKDNIYCLKIDISKYFYNIDHNILLNMLSKKIYDKDVLWLIKTIISETNNDYVNDKVLYFNNKYNTDIPLYINNKGLSIGAVTSQFLAIFYLNDLDHFIKEELCCKYYIRYMDDILILDTNKDRLKYIFNKVSKYLIKLKLSINKKSNIYRLDKGIEFLGYKYYIYNNKVIKYYNKKTYYRIKSKLKYLYYKDKFLFYRSYNSYNGYFLNKENVFMKNNDLYKIYKDKYKNSIILIKSGIFYKTYEEDAKILWYLFGYKYIDNSLGFSSNSYEKVINKLIDINISFIVLEGNNVLLDRIISNDVFSLYKKLSIDSFDVLKKRESLINKLNNILDIKWNSYEKINNFFDNILLER